MPDIAGPLKLSTSLGDKLQFRHLVAQEELGRLFEFNVLGLADDASAIDPSSLIGTGASVSLELPEGDPRQFHGVVVSAGLESAVGRLASYRLVLRPWLWLLTLRSDTRIFENLSAVDIVKKVFENYTAHVEWKLQGSYPAYEYCVQYRETDFNFVSRLLEHEGIYYYFKHEAGNHTMVVCDKISAHAPYPGFDTIRYRDSQDTHHDFDAITEWHSRVGLPPSQVVLSDYDFLKPGTRLHTPASTTTRTGAKPAYEIYDQPGLFTELSRGNHLADLRMEELDARHFTGLGASQAVRGIAVGHLFKLADHPASTENLDYLVVSSRIEAQYSGYESGQGETQFQCHFSTIRKTDIWRTERTTPKPVVPGPQTAVVVGDDGEEITTDKYGRVRVQFHWNRPGKGNAEISCWTRVSSAWAGKGWGQLSLPRKGQEVIVDFLEGDPDRPLITGRVYNAVNLQPYKLPDHKTVSTLKSQSSIGGTTSNFNELRFEDKKDKEYIWFQAERNMRHLVKRGSWTTIRRNENRIVGGNLLESVGGDHSWTVKGKTSAKIGGDFWFQIGGTCWIQSAEYVFRTGAVTWSSGEVKAETGALSVSIGGAAKITADGKISIKGQTIVLEADTQISLKVGSNFVDIGASGVAIKGTMVLINSGGAAGSADKADGQVIGDLPAPDLPGEPTDPLTPQV